MEFFKRGFGKLFFFGGGGGGKGGWKGALERGLGRGLAFYTSKTPFEKTC